MQRHLANAGKARLDGLALVVAGLDRLAERLEDIRREETAQGLEIAVLIGHDDHLVGRPGAMGEFGDAEVGVRGLHRRQGPAGLAVGFDVMADVGVDGAAFDHLEGAVATLGGRTSGQLARLLVSLARPEDVAQAQDQEQRDRRENYDLDHLRAHRPPFHFRARDVAVPQPLPLCKCHLPPSPSDERGRGRVEARMWLFLIFVAVPIVEIALFIRWAARSDSCRHS